MLLPPHRVRIMHGLRPRTQNVAHIHMGHATQLELLHAPMQWHMWQVQAAAACAHMMRPVLVSLYHSRPICLPMAHARVSASITTSTSSDPASLTPGSHWLNRRHLYLPSHLSPTPVAGIAPSPTHMPLRAHTSQNTPPLRPSGSSALLSPSHCTCLRLPSQGSY